MVSVQEWAEIRRMRFVEGLAIREIRRRTGLHRETIRRALRSPVPPRYSRSTGPSKLDGFREQIHELLRGDPRIETQRILELLAEQGYEGGKSITYECVRARAPRCRCRSRSGSRRVLQSPGCASEAQADRCAGERERSRRDQRSAGAEPGLGCWEAARLGGAWRPGSPVAATA